MAHFAELDKNNVVQRVIVVDNKNCCNEKGEEQEEIGITFCQELCGGGRWVQTSYNNTFRKRFAGKGYTYNKELDAFIPPKPYKSWKLNKKTCTWQAPKPKPDDTNHWEWDEGTNDWKP